MPTLADAERQDARDPLRAYRERFVLPDGDIYLDGNSLGACPKASVERLAHVVADEWGQSLVRSWNDHAWVSASERIGAKIAAIIGAAPDEVIVADSTSVNLFKLLVATVRLTPERGCILTEAGNFPTDIHIAEGCAQLLGKRLVTAQPSALAALVDPDTAALVLSHVHYRTAYRHDMAGITREARRSGVPVIWDLSHSVGAVPLNLAKDGVELAVGCGYKFLNGGPGAPAFLYVTRGLQQRLHSPITGWFGHQDPFSFVDDYRPAPGLARFLSGTPPMLSLLALETGVDLMLSVDPGLLFEKSCGLFDLFARLMAARCPALQLVSPCDPQIRGSHIAFSHPDALAICNALIARGVIGDFRTPDVVRFGLTPLTLRFQDVWHAVDRLADIMDSESWRDPVHAHRSRVT